VLKGIVDQESLRSDKHLLDSQDIEKVSKKTEIISTFFFPLPCGRIAERGGTNVKRAIDTTERI